MTAEGEGFLTAVRGGSLMAVAAEADALVVQRAAVGDYVLPGQTLADVFGPPHDWLRSAIGDCFELGDQRTPAQDLAFTVRQLADIALKGLSPAVNDPTTAETALSAMAAILVRRAREPAPEAVRVDADGHPRLVARTVSLDELVRLGFEQVRAFAAPDAVVTARLMELLDRIATTAAEHGVGHLEATRQRTLLQEARAREAGAEVEGTPAEHGGGG